MPGLIKGKSTFQITEKKYSGEGWSCGCTVKIVQRRQRRFLGARWLVLGEGGGVEAEGLALIGGERGPVALEVSGNAATGGARTIAERLDASLPLQLCCIQNTQRERKMKQITTLNNVRQDH